MCIPCSYILLPSSLLFESVSVLFFFFFSRFFLFLVVVALPLSIDFFLYFSSVNFIFRFVRVYCRHLFCMSIARRIHTHTHQKRILNTMFCTTTKSKLFFCSSSWANFFFFCIACRSDFFFFLLLLTLRLDLNQGAINVFRCELCSLLYTSSYFTLPIFHIEMYTTNLFQSIESSEINKLWISNVEYVQQCSETKSWTIIF